jgi:hypothetical protein
MWKRQNEVPGAWSMNSCSITKQAHRMNHFIQTYSRAPVIEATQHLYISPSPSSQSNFFPLSQQTLNTTNQSNQLTIVYLLCPDIGKATGPRTKTQVPLSLTGRGLASASLPINPVESVTTTSIKPLPPKHPSSDPSTSPRIPQDNSHFRSTPLARDDISVTKQAKAPPCPALLSIPPQP